MKSPLFKFLLFLNLFLIGCISINVPLPKNTPTTKAALTYKNPESPFVEISPGDQFDRVWQSEQTKNSISLKSECKEDGSLKLVTYQNDFFNALDDSKVIDRKGNDTSSTVTLSGELDDQSVRVKIHTYIKNKCVINLTYIAKTKYYDKELPLFYHFLESLDEK